MFPSRWHLPQRAPNSFDRKPFNANRYVSHKAGLSTRRHSGFPRAATTYARACAAPPIIRSPFRPSRRQLRAGLRAVAGAVVRGRARSPPASGGWRWPCHSCSVMRGRPGSRRTGPARAWSCWSPPPAFFFAADLAAWHAGIHMTKLGNATLFGNVVELRLRRLGLWLARRWPSRDARRWRWPRRGRRGAADGQQLRNLVAAQFRRRPAVPARRAALRRLSDRRAARRAAR